MLEIEELDVIVVLMDLLLMEDEVLEVIIAQ